MHPALHLLLFPFSDQFLHLTNVPGGLGSYCRCRVHANGGRIRAVKWLQAELSLKCHGNPVEVFHQQQNLMRITVFRLNLSFTEWWKRRSVNPSEGGGALTASHVNWMDSSIKHMEVKWRMWSGCTLMPSSPTWYRQTLCEQGKAAWLACSELTFSNPVRLNLHRELQLTFSLWACGGWTLKWVEAGVWSL